MKQLLLIRSSIPNARGSIRHFAGINLAFVAGAVFRPALDVFTVVSSSQQCARETADIYLRAAGNGDMRVCTSEVLDPPNHLLTPETAELLCSQAAQRGISLEEILFEPETGLGAELADYGGKGFAFLVECVQAAAYNTTVLAFSHAVTIESIAIAALRASKNEQCSRPFSLREIGGLVGYAEAVTIAFSSDDIPLKVSRPDRHEIIAALSQRLPRQHRS